MIHAIQYEKGVKVYKEDENSQVVLVTLKGEWIKKGTSKEGYRFIKEGTRVSNGLGICVVNISPEGEITVENY